ncbi:DUF6531 domain-containing protein [Amycolatopsis samaneae]|uniref:DUF6531 domain-containing protein n=1 Tax=Amycolatopsis samaneae TaxID=664691 RepID=A0ABW5GN80_9PSEU
MDGNPLVAQAQSQTTGVTGIGVLESANDLANGVKDGSWVEAGLGGLGVGLEVLSLVTDPIGTLAQYGVSWLIEHVKPLKDCLDWLAGNPPVIQSFSDTWANVSKEVNAIAGDLSTEAKGGTAGWTGEAGDSYRGEVAEQTDALAGAASLCDGISGGVMVMGQVVAAVRETVRDLIGTLVGKLISWALEEACTLGFATPAVAVQATTAITNTINKVSTLIRKLIKTISNVGPKVRKIVEKLGEIIEKLSKLAKRLGKRGEHTSASAARKAEHAADDVHAPKDHTSPSSAHESTSPSGTHDGTSPSGTKGSEHPDTGSPSSKTDPSGPGAHDSGTGSPGSADPGGSRPPGKGDGTTIGENADPRVDGRDNPWKCTDGDPIDLATGEMITGYTDLDLPGVLPLVLRRSHHSSYRVGRSFGGTWSSTLDQRLEIDDDGIWYAAEDGVLLRYPHPARAGEPVEPVEGARRPLVRDADGGYAVRDVASGRTWRFAPGAGSERPLSTITDRNGNRIDLLADKGGQVTEIRHTGGYRVAVDRDGPLVTGLRVLDGTAGDVHVLRFGYDGDGRLAEVVNSSGRAERFSYDVVGRVVRWEDRTGEWYAYHYDENGRCVRTEGSGGVLTCRIDYDVESRITTYVDARGHVTRYHFNERWQLVREISPLGVAATFTWDRYDRLLSRRDPLGRVTAYGYDDAGNITSVTRPDGRRATSEYNAFGQPVVITDPDGAVWRYEYDGAGNRTAIIDPSGARTSFGYGMSGELVATSDALGNTHRFENTTAGLPAVVTDPTGAVVRYQRDLLGRVVSITDPHGSVSRLSWTVEGKLLARTAPDGATEEWRYDSEGNHTEHVDPLGKVTTTRYTHFGLPASRTTADGATHTFEYDTELHLTAVTNPHGLVWRYEYDAMGQVTSETDFNGRTVRYRHNEAGELVERVNGAGETVRYTRDLMGNVLERDAAGAVTSFEYDPLGRVLRARNADSEVVYRRDVLGRPLTESVNGRAVELTYDVLGRKIGRRTPSGAESHWRYDANNRPVELRAGGHALAFAYDVSGRETTRWLGGGSVLTQAWDGNDRLIGQTIRRTADESARPVRERRFYYRQDGYLGAVEDQAAGPRAFDLDPVGRIQAVRAENWSERYAYDTAGNLVAAESPADGETTAGPRQYSGTLLKQAGNTRYEHDSQGRLVSRTQRTLSGKQRSWRYEWDAEDRLTGVVTPDGARWRYTYDATGRRLAKVRLGDDGETVLARTGFTWEGTYLVEQDDHTGKAVTWDWRPGTTTPVSQFERSAGADGQDWYDERFYSIVTDLIGTPTELVATDGAVAWSARTTLWGQPLAPTAGQASTPLRFPGQYHDEESGLHYNYYRYYDPGTARYLDADPLGYLGGADPHAYVANPTMASDFFGLTGYACGLTQTGPNTYDSPAGLRYNPDPSPHFDSRFDHVLNHAQDIPGRPQHGVFADPNPNSVGQVVDDAYRRVQNGEAFSVPQGNRMVHYVNMNEDVGYIGGVPGAASGHPPARYIQLVLENGNEVITAFPVSGIPSRVLG